MKTKLKPVKKAGLCIGCKYFYFNPDKEKTHYYYSESDMQGECTKLKEKIGTTSMSQGCRHWELKE